MFSARSQHGLQRSAFALAIEAARASGRSLLDLTESNPTRAGIPYDHEEIGEALRQAARAAYEPDPRGLVQAREAIAALIGGSPERLLITSSTSEAYGLLISLLCDPGDEILIPAPGYPLLEHLCEAQCVKGRPYPLRYDGEWYVDLEALREGVNASTRAIVSVSPNNPTGSFLRQPEFDTMLAQGLPVIVDEVFASYPLESPRERARRLEGGEGLVFWLDGLSKRVGMPGAKLGWIAVQGKTERVEAALERLEWFADLTLSTGAWVQRALPGLLRAGARTQRAIHARLRSNLETIRESLGPDSSISLRRVEAGWYAILRLPAVLDEERWMERCLDAGLLVQPGWFYDLGRGPHCVISLLTREAILHEGLARLSAIVASAISSPDAPDSR